MPFTTHQTPSPSDAIPHLSNGEQLVVPQGAENVIAEDPEVVRKQQLMEILLSRHEELIDRRLAAFARRWPEIGEDAVRSTFYLNLAKRCIRTNDLLELQDSDLKPLNPEREGQIIGGLIKYSRLEEYARHYPDGPHTRAFSQMEDYDPGLIPGRALETAPLLPAPPSLAGRLADRLYDLNLALSDRQFNILLCQLEGKRSTGKTPTYSEIASQLNISDTTVRREVGRITKKILEARGVDVSDGAPRTTSRREDFREILANHPNLRPRMRDYLETYLALSENGKRPSESDLREKLGLTPSQLKNRQRIAARLRPGLLEQPA